MTANDILTCTLMMDMFLYRYGINDGTMSKTEGIAALYVYCRGRPVDDMVVHGPCTLVMQYIYLG